MDTGNRKNAELYFDDGLMIVRGCSGRSTGKIRK